MINPGDNIYYFEYYDHGKTWNEPKEIFKKPFTLWCVGEIHEESKDFIAVLCSGTTEKEPNTQPSYEIIFKKAIIKQELIYTVE